MKIHKLFYILPLLIMAGCDDYFYIGYGIDSFSPAVKGNYLHLETTTLSFPGEASQEKLNVKAEGTQWKFSGMAPWLSLNPVSGSEDANVVASASENPSGFLIRTSIFNLNSVEAGYEKTFQISATQKASSPYVTVSPSEYTFGAGQSSATFSIGANTSWEISGNYSWLNYSVSPDSLSLSVTVDENTTTSSRYATLYFNNSNGTRLYTLSLTQDAPSTPVSSRDTLDFDQPGGTYSLTITSEVAWTVSTTDSWLEVTPASANAGSTKLNITANANTTTQIRTGHVDLYVGGKKKSTIVIRQKALYLTTDTENLTFKAKSESKKIAVNSNVVWSVISKPDWLTVSASSGSGSANLTLRAEDYWGSTNRSGILKLGATGTDLTTSVSIVQEGRFFDDIAALLTFSAAAGTNSIDITTDGKWAAKISDDASSWLTISPTTGTGSGTLQVSVTENTDDDERTASVDVTVGTTTKTVGIVQRGKFFTVSPSTFATLASTGGSHAIHIASDDSWTAQSSSTWMTLSRASGTGNVDVTLTAPDYPSIKARDDTTTFTPVYAQPVRVITRQLGRYLTVDVISIRFFGKGGTSNAVQISTDGTFNISASDNWFSVERQGNTFTVIATEITTDTQREGKVIITMTGLLPGEEYVLEVPVIQRPKSSGLDVWTFDDDQQWELNGDGTFAIRVTGFSADKNWNDTSSEGLTIKVTTFSEDKLWDY